MDGFGSFTELLGRVSESAFLRAAADYLTSPDDRFLDGETGSGGSSSDREGTGPEEDEEEEDASEQDEDQDGGGAPPDASRCCLGQRTAAPASRPPQEGALDRRKMTRRKTPPTRRRSKMGPVRQQIHLKTARCCLGSDAFFSPLARPLSSPRSGCSSSSAMDGMRSFTELLGMVSERFCVWPRTSGARPGDGFEGHLGDSVYHGASESGHSSPGVWGSGWEEDNEPSEGSAQPICADGRPPLFWSEDGPQPAAIGGDEHIHGDEYAAAAEAFADEMHAPAAPGTLIDGGAW